MKVGLALSGGGVKGAAHIGVIRALLENGISIDMIGGTSSGSIVASLYAMGYTPEEILTLFHTFSKTILKLSPQYINPDGSKILSIHAGGLLSGENLASTVKQAGKEKQIEKITDIKMPLVIPTVDINTSEKYVFTNSDKIKPYYIKDATIGEAVRASASYPGVYATCPYEKHRFVDGGILDNIPSEEVKDLGANKVISVKFKLGKTEKVKGLYTAFKAIDIIFDRIAEKEVEGSDYVLDIDTANAGVFNIKKIDDCYQAGYIQTLVKIKEIKKCLQE